jgi:hypothetical protein
MITDENILSNNSVITESTEALRPISDVSDNPRVDKAVSDKPET